MQGCNREADDYGGHCLAPFKTNSASRVVGPSRDVVRRGITFTSPRGRVRAFLFRENRRLLAGRTNSEFSIAGSLCRLRDAVAHEADIDGFSCVASGDSLPPRMHRVIGLKSSEARDSRALWRGQLAARL
jgi:hypothetical protein